MECDRHSSCTTTRGARIHLAAGYQHLGARNDRRGEWRPPVLIIVQPPECVAPFSELLLRITRSEVSLFFCPIVEFEQDDGWCVTRQELAAPAENGCLEALDVP